MINYRKLVQVVTEEMKHDYGSDASVKQMKKMTPGQKEEKDPGEYDQEGDMAKTQLRTIADAAKELHDMLGDDDNMPEWAQNKITKAADYIDSVRDYLKSEKNDD
jgi:nitric oxide reductase large subunit